ncbi:nucleoplasmin-like [Varanus komodoensis]|uniref:nucleoplasmin-like n=1 Tax=Varanus komodoensis TaxID=61221 RepID=UPI001CF77439|nr:nucleoplasmin-like [Varanus komodoensis]
MAMEASFASTNGSLQSEKPVCLIWGCQLSGENPTYTFDVPKEWSYEQQLALRTICLGENAKDEFNIVEIIPPKNSKEPTPIHIATLKLSVLPMATLSGFDLTPPVTFRLKSGSGPIFLAGQHVTVGLPWNREEEESSSAPPSSLEDEDLENSSKEYSPAKPAKGPSSKRAFMVKREAEQTAKEQCQVNLERMERKKQQYRKWN